VLLYTSLVSGASPLLFETCRVAELCAIAARAAKPLAAAKQQEFAQTIDPATPDIESDPQGIVQVVKELLVNAVKFTPAGGRIEVSVAPAADCRTVCIAVTDTGIGLSEEQLATIFHPFTQGDQTLARRFEGIGLGLAYVHEMVQRLGGTLAVASSVGKGSSFAVTLPLTTTETAETAETAGATKTTPAVDKQSVPVLR
jgi:two-component system sensor histidine kinase BarA